MGKNWYNIVSEQPERILCAAIIRKEPRQSIKPYHEGTNDILAIELGYRHHDILQRFTSEVSKSPYAQGFYTSKGKFVGRHEAMYIAFHAKQVPQNIAWEHPEEAEKSFVDFMNDMILGELKSEEKEFPQAAIDLNTIYHKEQNFKRLGYRELFSEDLY